MSSISYIFNIPLSDHKNFGPSEVRATSGQHLGGHYFAYINLFSLSLFLLPPLFKTTEGVVVGFQIFAWAPKKK